MCKLHVFQAHPNTAANKNLSNEIHTQTLTLKGRAELEWSYSNVGYGTTTSGHFLCSASHRAMQAKILARLAALSTFSVATMRAQSSESARQLEERTEVRVLQCALAVEPRARRRSRICELAVRRRCKDRGNGWCRFWCRKAV